MQTYEAIEKGIENHDVAALREAIGSICYTCRDFSNGEFDAVVSDVEKRGIKLREDQLIGEATISSRKTSFTDEDFAKAVFYLKGNFCDERIEDVKKIGKTLYASESKNQNKSLNAVKENKRSQTGKNPNQVSHQSKQDQNIKIFVSLGVMAIIMVVIICLLLKK